MKYSIQFVDTSSMHLADEAAKIRVLAYKGASNCLNITSPAARHVGKSESCQVLSLHISSDTMAELKQMMDNNTVVLSQIVQRTSRFRTTRASRAPQSIFEMSFSTQSIRVRDGDSVISSTLFSFDDEIVNSQAYRQALAKASASSRDENRQSADRSSGADSAPHQGHSSVNQLPDSGRRKAPELRLS